MNDLEKLISEIHSLLNEGTYTKAKGSIMTAIEKGPSDNESLILFNSTIAGLLIDLGAESYDVASVEMGLRIMSDNELGLKDIMSGQSFNYNMGNAMHSLYKIQNRGKGLPDLEMIKSNLSQAKNYYFKAYKDVDLNEIGDIDLRVLTNLGNNLSQSGRIIEAIRLYRSVLKSNPDFQQALIGLAEALDYWIRISFCPRRLSLYYEVYSLLERGISTDFMPPNSVRYYMDQKEFYQSLLNENEFDFSSGKKELMLNEEEYNKHSEARKFYIDNYLTLNEHSIYCGCFDSSKDDLSVVHESVQLFGDKVGRMELLLNRMKSEFSLARKLYYEGVSVDNSYSEVLYSELMDGEVVGNESEKMRTSFRLCFGIFDKIANAICYFFDLPKSRNEKIYFESFWNTRQCPERWNKLKELKNPHLVALFSIANDFSSKEGEFHFYKQWRNKLEHGNLFLVMKLMTLIYFNYLKRIFFKKHLTVSLENKGFICFKFVALLFTVMYMQLEEKVLQVKQIFQRSLL